jgi:protoporphyrinogen oxidase
MNDVSEITETHTVAQDRRLPKIAILGAGPAGLGAALRLARDGLADVEVIEARDRVGGNAASFLLEGVHCDFGSHRLHPKLEERVMSDIAGALGADLLWRPRHGRIRLKGRWIHFPLKPADLLFHLPFSFTVSLGLDLVSKIVPHKRAAEETFASVLQRGLGSTMSRSFYFPYARKLWGLEPEALAVTAARRRIANSSIRKILLKIMRQIPGLKSAKAGGFYYPRKGFGQISQALRAAGEAHGARFVLGARISRVEHDGKRVQAVHYQKDSYTIEVPVDAAWSTLPVSLLVQIMNPPPPPEIMAAAKAIRFRGMILIYLVLEQDQFSEFDAHYFPEESIPISRLSEPKNYSGSVEPRGLTVLCAELPSDPGEENWTLSDGELGSRLCRWLADVDLPVKAPVRTTVTQRLGQAYPVYERGYAAHFDKMDQWLSALDGVLTFGRQGLFAHDNTHHALTMAYAAADCFQSDGTFNRALWSRHRRLFESHVVED